MLNLLHNQGKSGARNSMAGNVDKFDYPPLEEIIETWYTTDRAAEIMGVARAYVRQLFARNEIVGFKIGSERRGVIYVYPPDADNFSKRKPGPKPKVNQN